MLYTLGKLTVCCFLALFFKVDIKGQNVVPSKGPFILASNHVSYFDPPLLGTVIKRRVWSLAKEELFCNWLVRAFLKELGAIPLKRKTNDFRAMRQALLILKQSPLLLFPQGFIGAPWDEINSGVGFLAKKTGVPVIAARIYGAENIFPLFKRGFHKEEIRVIFSRVDEIRPKDTREEITDKVMAKIKSL
ncbi:MAG: lysophospholipid acyltransferase family protein [Candidatus Aceula meridiana]|nr:lysophospholipid acyltransferase family protein [Candidatus Aceula meridiana]